MLHSLFLTPFQFTKFSRFSVKSQHHAIWQFFQTIWIDTKTTKNFPSNHNIIQFDTITLLKNNEEFDLLSNHVIIRFDRFFDNLEFFVKSHLIAIWRVFCLDTLEFSIKYHLHAIWRITSGENTLMETCKLYVSWKLKHRLLEVTLTL